MGGVRCMQHAMEIVMRNLQPVISFAKDAMPQLAFAAVAVLGADAQSTCVSSHRGDWFPGVWPSGGVGVGSALDVGASGATIGVGVPFAAHNGNQSGAVYVICDQGSPHEREHTLLPSIASSQRQFGRSVAMNASGDVLVAGAPGSSFQASGRAFVFRFDGRTWSEEFVIDLPYLDRLGFTVDMSDDGNVIVVGAPDRSPWPTYVPGAVEVYRRGGGSWIHEATVVPTDQIYSYAVGLSISLSGDGRVLAMRAKSAINSIQSSSIYIYENVGSSWVQRAKLFDPTGLPSPGFGMAMDLDARGETLAVGNASDSRLVYMQGAVTIMRRDPTTWSYDAVVLPSTPTSSGSFGFHLALNSAGDRLIVGAPAQYHGTYRGVVEEFELFSGGSTPLAVHQAPAQQDEGQFGRYVAMNATGSHWVASKPFADTYGPDFGEVHLYQANCLTPQTYCTSQTNTLGCVAQISAQGTPSVSSPGSFRVTARNVRNLQNGMLLYGTSGRAATPWLGGTLCVQPPLRRTPLVNSGGSPAPANDCSGVLVRDFNAVAASGVDPALFPGQHVRAQFYSRDPGASHNVNLSDAVEFYLEP